ncbi:MATH domain and coiled-coil domain-containing protein At3g58370 isoform X1 [Quercus suber]|uniref:MATH domain and coiled-coil domain-containing protein At3g58370 isoform X1 n=1 Tax=Quercus suber TaxID=58331 RepID=UPI0032DE6863
MKFGDSATTNFCDELSISRSKRHLPPTHYMLKIESYSILSETVEKYESGVFEAGGHKWRLSLYPKGNKKMNGTGHISLYLAIVETENLPFGWEIYVNFKLFVFDQIRDKYLTIHDADDNSSIKRFHDMKTEWGFTKFLPLDTFNDVSHGYLVNDCCLFGVEVFVHKHSGKLECVSMTKKPDNCTLTWKIENFSALDEESYSQEFTVADSQWKILVYPKGNSIGKAKAISVYLCSCNCLLLDLKYFAKFKLRIRDQINKNHVENTAKHWFSKSLKAGGFSQFLLLENLNDASKGFLVNDTLIVEAEIMAVSNIKLFAN